MAETVAAQHVEEKKEEKAVTIPKAPLAFMPSSWDDAYRIAKTWRSRTSPQTPFARKNTTCCT